MKTIKINFSIKSLITSLILIVIFTLISGCAQKMALRFDNPPTTNTVNSLVLFTLQTENQLNPRHIPCVEQIKFSSTDSKSRNSYIFKLDEPDDNSNELFNHYLVSIYLQPGSYVMKEASGQSPIDILLLFPGTFYFSVNATIDVPPLSIVYCGHISMTNRERKEDEPRSGWVLPYLNQKMSGFSNGTFDIVISDKSETDIAVFQKEFPWLRNKEIKTVLMKKLQ